MTNFEVEFITYNGLYKHLFTDKLNFPTPEGRRTLLANHMPTMIPISVGVIETNEKDQIFHYAATEGVVYFKDNKATVICDQILYVEDINIDMALMNLKKAENEIKNSVRDSDVVRAKIALARTTNLINAKNNYSNKK